MFRVMNSWRGGFLDGVAARLAAGELGEAARGIQSLRVVLRESHLAWAAYESELSA